MGLHTVACRKLGPESKDLPCTNRNCVSVSPSDASLSSAQTPFEQQLIFPRQNPVVLRPISICHGAIEVGHLYQPRCDLLCLET
jgi:hypothetical protein